MNETTQTAEKKWKLTCWVSQQTRLTSLKYCTARAALLGVTIEEFEQHYIAKNVGSALRKARKAKTPYSEVWVRFNKGPIPDDFAERAERSLKLNGKQK